MSAGPKPPRIVRLAETPPEWRGAVVAIGNFDGMHLGHQAVLAQARAEADRHEAACLVLTFEPHPRAYFSGRPLFRLTPEPLKAAVAAALGMDGVIVLPFEESLAGMSADEFVRGILAGRLGLSAAVTGYDFHFGKARHGTPEFLVTEGRAHGFGVSVVPPLTDDGTPVSSTRIRAALFHGDPALAARQLGRDFAFAGTVVPGDRRGRTLGYPTANMAMQPPFDLAHGIYAVRYLRPDGKLHDGVASYGRRPTFDNGEPVFETFVFDFDGDLYGETALVSLVGFIRSEERFDSVEALIARMDRDALEARTLLQRRPVTELGMSIGAAWAQSAARKPAAGRGR